MTIRYKEGSLPERSRAERKLRDERTARRPGAAGAPARMRLAHGYLVDFMIEEIARSGGESLEAGLDAVFAAFGSNFQNAIVNLAMNDPNPTGRAIEFLSALVGGVVERLAELQRGEVDKLEGFAELDTDKGEIGDVDFRRNGRNS
jgi:hypothetical protein